MSREERNISFSFQSVVENGAFCECVILDLSPPQSENFKEKGRRAAAGEFPASSFVSRRESCFLWT